MDFTIMAKPAGPQCNLRCAYCFYAGKTALFPGSQFRMTADVLHAYVEAYMQTHPGPDVPFAWQGGEPTLMGLSFFQEAVALQRRLAPPGKTARNALQTNGLLLDDDWCAFLAREGFLVGLSIDGPRCMHDVFRLDPHGRGSFDRVLQSLERMQRHGVEVNALVCVHAANEHSGAEVYSFLTHDLGLRHIQFIPVVELESGRAASRSVSPEGWGSFLLAAFDEWLARDLGTVHVQVFEAAFGAWLGVEGGLCTMHETCGRALVLEHDGSLYPCDHFVDPQMRLGNILDTPLQDMLGGLALARFGQRKKARLPGKCRGCLVLFACRGGCPKDRLAHGPYLCAGHRAFFGAIDQPMRDLVTAFRSGRPLVAAQGFFARSRG